MPSPDLSEVRVQRRAPVQCVSANPNGVRVRGANVPPTPELFSFFWYSLERKLVLYGKTIRQRALALIGVAHPQFREELEKAAHGLKYL
jgi:hypothetical protein